MGVTVKQRWREVSFQAPAVFSGRPRQAANVPGGSPENDHRLKIHRSHRSQICAGIRLRQFLHQRKTAIHHTHDVFEIVTPHEITTTAAVEGRDFYGHETRCGHEKQGLILTRSGLCRANGYFEPRITWIVARTYPTTTIASAKNFVLFWRLSIFLNSRASGYQPQCLRY